MPNCLQNEVMGDLVDLYRGLEETADEEGLIQVRLDLLFADVLVSFDASTLENFRLLFGSSKGEELFREFGG
jgi:hypothetical protein